MGAKIKGMQKLKDIKVGLYILQLHLFRLPASCLNATTTLYMKIIHENACIFVIQPIITLKVWKICKYHKFWQNLKKCSQKIETKLYIKLIFFLFLDSVT